MSQDLIATIDAAWEDRANVTLQTQGDVPPRGEPGARPPRQG